MKKDGSGSLREGRKGGKRYRTIEREMAAWEGWARYNMMLSGEKCVGQRKHRKTKLLKKLGKNWTPLT